MNVYDGIHWNIYDILPYQRHFNFINGTRSIGKSYTFQYFLLDRCISSNEQFIYLVRTQSEKKSGVFEQAFEKVIMQKFPDSEIQFTNEECKIKIESENSDSDSWKTLGFCFALSESVKIKKRSFPFVKWMMFDEYMLEPKNEYQYVNGWNEPDLLLNIYHTVDREEDRVIVFCFGNNTKFFNPYHMHPAFHIPAGIKEGDIWTSRNVLFQWAKKSNKLKEKQSKNMFLDMIENSQYGDYANKGEYIGDNDSFIEKLDSNCKYRFTLNYNGNSFGVYANFKKGKVYISNKTDPSANLIFALTLEDHNENTMLTKKSQSTHLKWLADNYKLGNVRFTSMETKAKIEAGLLLIL